uniref:Ricin B-type lectin domain-containing protein n=1 Tax=Panagrellus redivivus TaxID=6233 RepID=A0A7E4V6H9_PANRE
MDLRRGRTQIWSYDDRKVLCSQRMAHSQNDVQYLLLMDTNIDEAPVSGSLFGQSIHFSPKPTFLTNLN